jgi:hypothetical protein
MIQKIIFPIVAVLCGLFVIISILTSGSNALSESMIYLGVVGVILSLFNPNAGMAFLFIVGNYLDLIKRFLVVGGSFSWTDIIRTLAVAPIVTGTIFLGLTIRHLNTTNDQWPWARFALSSAIFLLVATASFFRGDSLQNVAQSIANGALYAGFICYAAFLYKNHHAHHKIFRLLMVIFIPVAVYGWIQLIYGYNTIEQEYARSGFTVSMQPTLHPSEVEYRRVFSTMNSAGAYTLVGSILSIYGIIFGFGRGILGRITGCLFAILCLSSHIPGAGRTGWAIVIVTYVSYFVFRSGRLTVATYAFTIAVSILFLINADTVGEWLVNNSQGIAGDSEFAQRASNMGTFTARTIGITEWMTKKEFFSWFGLQKSEITASGAHDMVGQIYVSTGVIGLSIALLFGGWVLVYLHRSLLGLRDSDDKRLASFYMANIFAILVSGVFSGSSLHIFPLNVYFWLMAGLLFQLIDANKAKIKEMETGRSTTGHDNRLSGYVPALQPAP